jgi:hypothetical protein
MNSAGFPASEVAESAAHNIELPVRGLDMTI